MFALGFERNSVSTSSFLLLFPRLVALDAFFSKSFLSFFNCIHLLGVRKEVDGVGVGTSRVVGRFGLGVLIYE